MSSSPTKLLFKHLGDYIGIAAERDGVVEWQKTFDAQELDAFIYNLARFRAGLPEVVNTTLDPNARVETTPRPAIVMRDHESEGFEVIFRHPGFGWISFLLAEQARRVLGAALLAERGTPEVPWQND